MNRLLDRVAAMAAAAAVMISCGTDGSAAGRQDAAAEADTSAMTAQRGNDDAPDAPRAVRALLTAYPDAFASDPYDGTNIRLADGTTIKVDDGRTKSHTERLADCDIDDMFAIEYKLPDVWNGDYPAFQSDPGRWRNEILFKKLYGSTEAAVRKQLTGVDWLGQRVQFSASHGAADSLRAVAAELAAKPHLRKWLKSSGTFYWRNVRGANRLSAHSFGIAIDIAVASSDYWLWQARSADENARVAYKNKFPREIVEIFQRHGFIWGGAWYHFDTMHFEFRPELLVK